MKKRKLELAVLSDIHLGSLACHADELLSYLSSIKPKRLVLNGNIIDDQELSKGYFPSSHMKVIKKIIGMAAQGTEVLYVTANGDKNIQKLNEFSIGKLNIVNKLVLQLDGKNAWFFHGDILDCSISKIRWLSKLGIKNHNVLAILNNIHKWILFKTKREPLPKTEKTKQDYNTCFENYVVDMAISNTYDYVICGHLQEQKKKYHHTEKGKCTYLNSGDWVKNLTALEYAFKRWKIYKYDSDKLLPFYVDEDMKDIDIHDIITKITLQKEQEKQGDLSIDDGAL